MANIEVKTTLENGDTLSLGKKWISSIESIAQTTDSPTEINYAAISSSGSLTIRDIKGEFRRLIENEEIDNNNLPIEIYANGQIVQNHIGTASDYNLSSYEFSIDLNNKIAEFENMQYAGYQYQGKPTTVLAILWDILGTVGYTIDEITEMLSEKYYFISSDYNLTVRQFLGLLKITYPYLPASTVKEAIDKICSFAQLYCYEKNDGKLTFSQARPSSLLEKNIYVADASVCFGDFSKTIILKNKYNEVKVVTKEFTEETSGAKKTTDDDGEDVNVFSTTIKGEDLSSWLMPKAEETSITGTEASALKYAYGTGQITAAFWEINVEIPVYNDLAIVNEVFSGMKTESEPYITVKKYDTDGNVIEDLILSENGGPSETWFVTTTYPAKYLENVDFQFKFNLPYNETIKTAIGSLDTKTNTIKFDLIVFAGYSLKYQMLERKRVKQGNDYAIVFEQTWEGSDLRVMDHCEISFRGIKTTITEKDVEKVYVSDAATK